jgi:hypothetical protein
MEKPYLYLSLMMVVVLIIVFIATAVIQTKIATLAIIIFSFLILLFYIRDKSEKIEMITMWFTLMMFFVTAALLFKPGGF